MRDGTLGDSTSSHIVAITLVRKTWPRIIWKTMVRIMRTMKEVETSESIRMDIFIKRMMITVITFLMPMMITMQW